MVRCQKARTFSFSAAPFGSFHLLHLALLLRAIRNNPFIDPNAGRCQHCCEWFAITGRRFQRLWRLSEWRGIDLCHETVRLWWNRLGPMFAVGGSAAARVGHWQWHVDEVFVRINGEPHYLWRAVDHEGEILESYVTKTRNKATARAFLKKR